MRRGLLGGAFFSLALLWQLNAQQIEIARETPTKTVALSTTSTVDDEEEIAAESLKVPPSHKPTATAKMTVDDMRKAGALAREKIEKETRLTTSYLGEPPKPALKRTETAVRPMQDRQSRVSDNTAVRSTLDRLPRISEAAAPQPISFSTETAFTKLADGFDFAVGKPDAQGYYKARGYRSRGHLGEDWDGVRGGDSDLGDPVYTIGDGVVVFARDCHMGWGNVVIIRHAYREYGEVKNIDSLYGHLNTILVKRGQAVSRGQKIATMGNAHGLYDAHLHLEIRKNLSIGMSRAKFARDSSNYHDPTQFILSHRHLQTSTGSYRIAMNTFTHDALIHWDRERNFSHARTGGGSSESAAALKKAVASQH